MTRMFLNTTFKNSTEKILIFAGSILCLLLSSSIEFVLNYVVNIRVRLINEIPWCSQKSILPIIRSLFKLAQGVCLAVAIPQATAIVLFILSTIQLAAFIYFQPQHNRKVHFIDLVFMSVLFAEYAHLLVASFDSSTDQRNGSSGRQGSFTDMVTVLLFFLSFLIPAFAQVVSLHRQQRLQSNLLEQGG